MCRIPANATHSVEPAQWLENRILPREKRPVRVPIVFVMGTVDSLHG